MSGVSMGVRDRAGIRRSEPTDWYVSRSHAHEIASAEVESRYIRDRTCGQRGMKTERHPTCGYVGNCKPRSYPHTHRLNKERLKIKTPKQELWNRQF